MDPRVGGIFLNFSRSRGERRWRIGRIIGVFHLQGRCESML